MSVNSFVRMFCIWVPCRVSAMENEQLLYRIDARTPPSLSLLGTICSYKIRGYHSVVTEDSKFSCVVTLCRVTNTDCRFGEMAVPFSSGSISLWIVFFVFDYVTLKMKVTRSFGTSATTCQSSRRNIPATLQSSDTYLHLYKAHMLGNTT